MKQTTTGTTSPGKSARSRTKNVNNCTHHWLIEPGWTEKSKLQAKCKLCGAERYYNRGLKDTRDARRVNDKVQIYLPGSMPWLEDNGEDLKWMNNTRKLIYEREHDGPYED